MQPYLYYGLGIRAVNLPKDVRERLLSADESICDFVWFYEDAAGRADEDSGVFYIIKSSPWTRNKQDHGSDFPWAATLDDLIAFKEANTSKVHENLVSAGLVEYSDKVELLCSVTEI